jgi:hypothetical protein
MIIALLVVLLPIAPTNDDPAWSEEVIVRQGIDPVVRLQARIAGDHLIVKATHKKGWHTYAMDNELRAAAALAGKRSLGIEQGIDIQVETGLELDDQWLQTAPKDFSQPKLRWFTYGFDETALFACRVNKVTANQIVLRIRGQACSGETCCQVNALLKLPATNHPVDEQPRTHDDQIQVMLKSLVPKRTPHKEPSSREPKS